MLSARRVFATGRDTREPWSLAGAVFVQSQSLAANATFHTGLFIGNAGTRMYVVTASGDDVLEYSLSTAWDISTASYTRSLDVSAQEGQALGIALKPDGTRLFVCGGQGDDVNEYSLSTAWNLSTASHLGEESVAANSNNPGGLAFSSDGTKMYISSSSDVDEYALSSAWDLSTASYTDSLSVSAQFAAAWQPAFSGDGDSLYLVGADGKVSEYSLSTPWDISTASHVRDLDVSDKEATPTGLIFNDDGTRMYVSGPDSDAVHEYSLAAP
jgi:hypothetical protein